MARFYFDRAIYWWGSFVEGKINEAEARAVQQTRKMKGNPQGFIASAKQMAYAKILGLPVTSAFRQPDTFQKTDPKANGAKSVPAEGKIDLSLFNG